MAKKQKQTTKTCAYCIHESACRAWVDGRYIADSSASRCPNFKTVEELADFLADKYVTESFLRLNHKGYEATEIQKRAIKHSLYCTWMKWLKQPSEDGHG